MWTTFKDCLDTILSNLDDFAVIIFIFIVGNKLADLLYRFLANFMKTSLVTAQSVKLLLQVFIGVISFVHLVGDDIIKHASAGIASSASRKWLALCQERMEIERIIKTVEKR